MRQERSPQDIAYFVSRFFETESDAIEAIQSILESDPQASSAEVFRQLSQGKGSGKSHASQYQHPQHQYKAKKGRSKG